MAESEENIDEPVEVKKYRVTVTISSLGNERRKIELGEFEEEGAKAVIANVDAAFGTIRSSGALTLTGMDGGITFANLDNVAFVEIQIG